MKKVVIIANRLNAIQGLQELEDIEVVRLYILEGSLLDKQREIISLGKQVEVIKFTMKDKARLISEIASLEFDLLISNGCPFILPVTKIRKDSQLFINIHPTLLPDLKGKTPLSGVFMTHRKFIGATMHYIDDGIDTGNIIAQKKVELTPDIDQGLVYQISFELEKDAFVEGMVKLQESNYQYQGVAQQGEGSYFNRTNELQTIDMQKDKTDIIIDKIKSFNLRGQGTSLSTSEHEYKIYFAERITNPYLLKRYEKLPPSDIVLAYDNKVILRTMDGMLKLIDYEVVE